MLQMDELWNIIGSERTQILNPHSEWFYLHKMPRTGKSLETEISGLAGVKGYEASFWDDKNIVELRQLWWLYNCVNMLKNHGNSLPLKGKISWYVNYIYLQPPTDVSMTVL